MSEFIKMQDLLADVSPEEQQAMEARAKVLALASDAANRSNLQTRRLGDELRSMGAKLVAKLPNGQEISLPLPGVHAH
ncbi:MAG: hypothetical protein Q8R95_00885 [Azonexus sp.]|nr:hypothetical protein [Azonexus sp.]